MKVDDVVFITDDNVAPLQWPLWRFSYVYSGPDNFVRVVKVRTQSGIYNRAVYKLEKCLYLLTENSHLLTSQTHFDSNESRRAVYVTNIFIGYEIFELQVLFQIFGNFVQIL